MRNVGIQIIWFHKYLIIQANQINSLGSFLNNLCICITFHLWTTNLQILHGISVNPESESVHIGVSDTKYTVVDQSARAEMEECLILKAEISLEIDLDKACTKSVYGRYVYISLIRESDVLGKIRLYEIRVFMGKNWKSHTLLWSHMSIYRWLSAILQKINC